VSRHEAYGCEKLICYGLKRIFHHIFKGLSTKQDDENSQHCVCHSVSHLKYKHCRPCRILWPAVYARCFTGNILQNSSQGHWEVEIFSIAAEGT